MKIFSFYNNQFKITIDSKNIVFEQKIFSKTKFDIVEIKKILEVEYKHFAFDGSDNLFIHTTDGEIKWKIQTNREDRTDGTFEELTNYLEQVLANNSSEIKKKCRVCGKVFCYNWEDISENERHTKVAGLAALGSLVGSRYDMYEQHKIMNENQNQIVDYNKCPNCGSRDLIDITNEDEIEEPAQTNNTNSDPYEEIRKLKGLLDDGIITQEEFDKKKKELLGL